MKPAIIEARPEHYGAIVAIERESASGSLVALTEGHALSEAAGRGHHVVVALDGDDVVGWAWYARSLERGAEEIGQVFRVGVAEAGRRSGVGRALLEHARGELASLGARRVRVTVPGDDAGALAFFEAAGFTVEAVVMEATEEPRGGAGG